MLRVHWVVSVLCIVVIWGGFSCARLDGECINGIQLSEYNPNSLRCLSHCDCSNLRYEGYCTNGHCFATLRTQAQRKGEIRACKLFQPVGSCEWGTQEAQPDPLDELLWGDCIPPTPVPENTLKLCTDDLDNDCNGLKDDKDPSCARFCVKGRSEICYSGDHKTLNQGRCRAGIRDCQADSVWSPCTNEILPTSEICNNQDDDCNGLIDDGLVGCETTEQCEDGAKKPCYTALEGCSLEDKPSGGNGFRCLGLCKTGSQRCVNKKWTPCEGEITPAPKNCDGQDHNCDGKIDEDCACPEGEARACFLDGQGQAVGECKAGRQECKAGIWGNCVGAVLPQVEICDGKDNDCNGLIDDNLSPPLCAKQKGVCAGAVKVCVGAAGWLECTDYDYKRHNPAYVPFENQQTPCDKLDNDCDGKVDVSCFCTLDAHCSNEEFCGDGWCRPKNHCLRWLTHCHVNTTCTKRCGAWVQDLLPPELPCPPRCETERVTR